MAICIWFMYGCMLMYDYIYVTAYLSHLLEHSPLSKDFEYRMQLTKLIPSLVQIDATLVTR